MKRKIYSLCFIIATLLALGVPLLTFAAFTSPPTIGTPIIQPASPKPGDTVTVSVNVTEAHPGVMNVSIVYTTDNWRSVNVTVPATYNATLRTWTASIPPIASGGHVSFYVVSFDYNNNRALNNNSGSYFSYNVTGANPPATTLTTSGWIIMAVVFGGIGSFAVVLLRSVKTPSSKPRTTS